MQGGSMSDVRISVSAVHRVDGKAHMAIIEIEGIECRFALVKGRPKCVGKTKIGARVHNSKECYLTNEMLRAATRLAAGILLEEPKPRRHEDRQLPLF